MNADDKEANEIQAAGPLRPTEGVATIEWEQFAKELGKLIGRRVAEEAISRRKGVTK